MKERLAGSYIPGFLPMVPTHVPEKVVIPAMILKIHTFAEVSLLLLPGLKRS